MNFYTYDYCINLILLIQEVVVPLSPGQNSMQNSGIIADPICAKIEFPDFHQKIDIYIEDLIIWLTA